MVELVEKLFQVVFELGVLLMVAKLFEVVELFVVGVVILVLLKVRE